MLTSASDITAQAIGTIPVLEAVLTSNQTISGSTFTTVQLDSVILDNTSAWDGANYKWVPQISGIYAVHGTVVGDATSGSTRIITAVAKNGTNSIVSDIEHSSTGTTKGGSGIRYFSMNGTTDYITLVGYIIGSGTIVFAGGTSGNGHSCRLSAHLIRTV